MKYDVSCIEMQIIYTDGQCLKNYLWMVLKGKEIILNLMKLHSIKSL